MNAHVKRRLLIKHVLGRVFLDTAVESCEFRLAKAEDDWTITILGMTETAAEHITGSLTELNLFYFEENIEDHSVRKWWLYDTNAPSFHYDHINKVAILNVNTRISYSNDKV